MSNDQTTYKTVIYSHQLSVFLFKSVRTLNRFRKLTVELTCRPPIFRTSTEFYANRHSFPGQVQ